MNLEVVDHLTYFHCRNTESAVAFSNRNGMLVLSKKAAEIFGFTKNEKFIFAVDKDTAQIYFRRAKNGEKQPFPLVFQIGRKKAVSMRAFYVARVLAKAHYPFAKKRFVFIIDPHKINKEEWFHLRKTEELDYVTRKLEEEK